MKKMMGLMMIENSEYQCDNNPREVVAAAIREVVAMSDQPDEVGELIASWYSEVLEGNVQLEPETAAVRDRAFQELERVFDRMWTPSSESAAPDADGLWNGESGVDK